MALWRSQERKVRIINDQGPMFSLVIPTRNRPDRANETLARALEQTWPDFEIIVLENSDSPSLGVWQERDARVRVVPAPQTLSMPDNWERGLDLARGEYVLYLSDKDWLVPHAFRELAMVITSQSRPALVNFRKAVWSPDYGLLMQQGTGRVASLPSAPAVACWFDCVARPHNLPMIYNSAVRRDLINVTRKHCGGRFFIGTAPDVASGLLLPANTPEYVVLDRIHAMAYIGPWSIGGSVTAGGRQGPSASFAAEFATDPLMAAGLVWSLTGVIAETLIACQRADPERLGSYQINWSRYLGNCLAELAERAARGQDTRGDVAVLRAGAGRLYPRKTWLRVSLPARLRSYARWLRDQTPLKVFLQPAFPQGRRRPAPPAPASPPHDPAVGFMQECFRPMIPAKTPEEGFAVILHEQTRDVPDTLAGVTSAKMQI